MTWQSLFVKKIIFGEKLEPLSLQLIGLPSGNAGTNPPRPSGQPKSLTSRRSLHRVVLMRGSFGPQLSPWKTNSLLQESLCRMVTLITL